MKLQQGQVWKQGDVFIRIIRLERLEVEYKSTTKLATKQGVMNTSSKKEFCRLIKGAELIPAKAPSAARKPAEVAPVQP